MDETELPCEKEIGNAHDPFARLPALVYFSSTSVILVFADDTAVTSTQKSNGIG